LGGAAGQPKKLRRQPLEGYKLDVHLNEIIQQEPLVLHHASKIRRQAHGIMRGHIKGPAKVSKRPVRGEPLSAAELRVEQQR
jgi:hypothetical protein